MGVEQHFQSGRLSRDASDGESWEAGTFAAYKSDGTEAIMLADVRAIIFSAVDANGNRMARNLDGVDWQRGFGGAFTLLVNDNQSIFSHTAAIKPATQSDIAYFGGEWDAYMIYWVGTHGNAIMSTVDGLSVGTKYQIHCPEIFF